MVKYYIVPVGETEAHLAKKRYTPEQPASMYEARNHAAFLYNTGRLRDYTYLDLAGMWGWTASTPRSKQNHTAAQANALKNRVKRVIDHVSDPANLWTLFDNSPQSDGRMTPISPQSDGRVTPISHHDEQNQQLTALQSDGRVTPISLQSDADLTIVRARGDAFLPNTEIDASRDQRSEIEIREEKPHTPLPPASGGDVGQGQLVNPVLTGEGRKARKQTHVDEPEGQGIPAGFPEQLLGRPDTPMLVKLWRDLKSPKTRRRFVDVSRVWTAYKQAFPRVRLLGMKDYRTIVDRIEEGAVSDPPITVDDICLVPAGVKRSSFHMGENESGKTYTGLESIFRDLKRVEEHIARARGEDEDRVEPEIRDVPRLLEPAPPLVPKQAQIGPLMVGHGPVGPSVGPGPAVPAAAARQVSPQERQLHALLNFAGRRIMVDKDLEPVEIDRYLKGLLKDFGPDVVAASIRSWKDDPQEPDDDKSDIQLWLPAKCRRLANTRHQANAESVSA